MGLNEIISLASIILFFCVLIYFLYNIFYDKIKQFRGTKMDIFQKKGGVMPMPPKIIKQAEEQPQQPNINMLDIMNKLAELEMLLNQHHTIIYEKINAGPVVLVEDEIKYVPEEEKETYIDIKKANPKMAETLLAGYKAKKK